MSLSVDFGVDRLISLLEIVVLGSILPLTKRAAINYYGNPGETLWPVSCATMQYKFSVIPLFQEKNIFVGEFLFLF